MHKCTNGELLTVMLWYRNVQYVVARDAMNGDGIFLVRSPCHLHELSH